MRAVDARRKGVRGETGKAMKKRKKTNDYASERCYRYLYSNKLGARRSTGQYIIAMLHKVMTSDDPRARGGRRHRMKVYSLVTVAVASADW